MERLSIHIEYLLLRHDCVVVPGFGAFINARSEARVDSESGQVYPMMREVRFNSALVHDDGLLAGSFARKYRVPFAEGREMLRKSIESLRRTMASDGEVTIGRLGIRHAQFCSHAWSRRRGSAHGVSPGFMGQDC